MSRLDDIEKKLEARMREIERKIGSVVGGDEVEAFPLAKEALPSRGVPRGMDKSAHRKIGITAGLTHVDPNCYEGWDGAGPATEGCGVDATDFANVLRGSGFETLLLLDHDVTWKNLSCCIAEAAELGAGDLFVLMVSGHGGQDLYFNHQTEQIEVHESWCLWDGEVLDNDIIRAFAQFAAGVRIVVVNDQCHAGGIFDGNERHTRGPAGFVPVAFSAPERQTNWKRAIGFRDSGRLFGRKQAPPMLIQFASCRAEQASIGMPLGGTWVTALLKVLAVSREISWREWFDRASKHMTLDPSQTPQWVELGPVTDAFRQGRVLV